MDSVVIRVHPRIFDQIGHQTTNASIGNKYFFTKKCHHQTYQTYEQSWQKLDTFLVNKVLQKSKFSKIFNNKSWSPNQIFFTEIFHFEIQRAPSEIPANLPGQFSLYGLGLLHWAAATLKGLVGFQNKKF